MPTKGAAKLSSETENYFEIMKQPFGTSTPPPPAPANKKKKKSRKVHKVFPNSKPITFHLIKQTWNSAHQRFITYSTTLKLI